MEDQQFLIYLFGMLRPIYTTENVWLAEDLNY